MKQTIAILGSTGSIGKSLLKIISKDRKNFEISLLTANENYKTLLLQAEKFKVKNLIITNKKYFLIAKSKNKKKINIYNDFNNFKKIFPKKIDYVMSSIVGLDGLHPTIKIIPFTKKIAIANKESIICAWNLIKKKLNKYKTKFVPVDSEHFSIWYALKNNSLSNLDKLYITASGGPLLNVPLVKYKSLNIKKITKHPNWNMGAKISVDSSTMMNKVFEVIEAKKIFNVDYSQISILIHPKSYIHTILKFKNGMIQIIAHDTTMDIPISNTLLKKNFDIIKTNALNINKLNNLQLSKPFNNKFPAIEIINKLPKKDSLFETVLVSINDQLVKLFLSKKINYLTMIKLLLKFISKGQFEKYKFIEPKKITDIFKLNNLIKSKLNKIDHGN
tara:strand:+ start:559 stop:1725 length:1167 start_codon:yes stop_codon:yes gene_type:complete